MTPSNNNNGGLVLQSEGRAAPPEVTGGGGGGGHLVEVNKKSLKKGPWTAAEDQILMEYVRKHGEGNWNSVQRNSGLNRCGKSCRLRWANHLRPNLKKGAFSPEEERLILELHAKYGNKWARMASQLPGRTDNEIKNYWNTRVKRRQRQGLPLYPHDIKQSQSHSQSQSHHHSHSQPSTSAFPQFNTTQNHLLATANGATPTFCFQIRSPTQASHHHTLSAPPLSPPSSPHHPKPTTTFTSLPIFDPTTTSSFTFHRPAPILGAPQCYKRYQDSIGSSPPISPTPQRSTSILRTGSMPDISSFQLTCTNSMPDLASFQFPRAINPALPPLPRTQFEFSDTAVYSIKSELPSNQLSQTNSEVTVDTKVTSTAVAAAAVPAATAEETHNNSGLLDELLQEAEALASGGGNNSRRSNALLGSFDDKHVLDGYGRWLQSTSSMDSSLLEAKPILQDHHHHHLNSMPEDLSKLFSFIPPTDPVSDWYSTDSGELSNGQSSSVTDASLDFEMQHMASLFPVGATAEHGRASSNWDNMPGIC